MASIALPAPSIRLQCCGEHVESPNTLTSLSQKGDSICARKPGSTAAFPVEGISFQPGHFTLPKTSLTTHARYWRLSRNQSHDPSAAYQM